MITIATLGGKEVNIQVDNLAEGASIRSLKELLKTETGVSKRNLKLYFGAEELTDSVSVGGFMEGREASLLSMMVVEQECGFCKSKSFRMKMCPCKGSSYCSTHCQSLHWKLHKAAHVVVTLKIP